jgi:CubicO group peptidase (beta-lactamase class C family)
VFKAIFFLRIFLVSLVSVSWPCACLASDTGMDVDIGDVLVEEGLTGVVWTLVREDDNVSYGTAGVQDNRSGTTFATDTRFHVGSLAKTVLATGVLRLVTEGSLDLDAPVHRYLPGLFSDASPAGFSEITVRHLLDHTSGLNDAHLWQMFSERADPNAPLVAAFPDAESQLVVRSRPGSRFSYSNMGYTLLGMIVESITGTRYEIYLDEFVLAPLGMRDSTFAFTTQEGDNADPTLAWGHVDDGSRYAARPIFLRPAGQFTTTTRDLARFAQFLLGDGEIDGQVFVDEALLRSRGKPLGTEAASEGLVAGYGLGLGRRDRHGVVGYCHGGNIVGFVAMLCIFPDEHKAFAYSVNTDSETANYGRLDALLIAALDIDDAEPPRVATPAANMAEWHGRYVLSPNRFQTFEYLDTVFGAVRVSGDADLLTLASLQQKDRHLRPAGGRLYSSNDRTTASHVFFRGKQGEYLFSDGFRTYEKVQTAYLAAHWTSIFLGFAGLVWILFAGSISLIRYRLEMPGRPVAPAFFATVLLLAPLPFFATQSFMALGDFTVASALLALVTLFLPIGMFLTILRARQNWRVSRVDLVHGLAAAFALQWCVVLAAAGLLPARLWV